MNIEITPELIERCRYFLSYAAVSFCQYDCRPGPLLKARFRFTDEQAEKVLALLQKGGANGKR
ncbi:hypothetical protein EOD23_11610 [Mesorhizobium sp. USDA-HM6]|nr:hypothetical protein EOD23_11610 [Mesorhizobium sp. USDA-HM6]